MNMLSSRSRTSTLLAWLLDGLVLSGLAVLPDSATMCPAWTPSRPSKA